MLDSVYKLLEAKNLRKSDLIRTMYSLEHIGFRKIIEDYRNETENELFASEEELKGVENLQSLTHNKIFRHMAIFLFNNSDVILDVLTESLLNLLGKDSKKLIDEVVSIIRTSIINPYRNDLQNSVLEIEHEELKDILGSRVRLVPTSHQKSSFKMLKKFYKSEDDIINKFIYHLRPKNTILKAEFIK